MGMVMVQALAPILDLLLCLPLVEILAIILHAMIETFRRLLAAIGAPRVIKKSCSCLLATLGNILVYLSALVAGLGFVRPCTTAAFNLDHILTTLRDL